MTRWSDARLHEELVERIGRQQHLQPILEPGENIDWETGVSCLHSVGGEGSPVQEGFIALSDRRIVFVPNGVQEGRYSPLYPAHGPGICRVLGSGGRDFE